jgi:hypothetical protein
VKNPNLKQTRSKPATKNDMIALARDVQELPDAYQAERARRLGVSEKGIVHALRRMSISYKKNTADPKTHEDKRYAFQETIKAYEAQNRVIVYIDESGFAHDMPRTHGYAPISKRCHGVYNWHARGRVNVIGALIGKALLTVGLFIANITADIFFAWVMQDLLPKLPPALVVVMDNVTFIKSRILKMQSHKPDIRLNICQPIHQILTPLSRNGHKPKQSENNKTKPLRNSLKWNHFIDEGYSFNKRFRL